MKRKPSLAHGLAKYQKEAEERKRKGATQAPSSQKPPKKKQCIQQVLLHSWSDKQRTLYPFRPSTGRMLILGEADFSFSRSLVENDVIPADQIVATCFEGDQEGLECKYPNTAKVNIEYLRERGCLVVFGVDATALSEKYLNGKLDQQLTAPLFDRIIFNFPHTGEGIKDRNHNIKAQQKLISAFLHSSTQLLIAQQKRKEATRPRHYEEDESATTEISRWTIMARSPSDNDNETPLYQPVNLQPEIHLTCWTGDPYDDWNVKGLAKEVRDNENNQLLIAKDSFSFETSRYSGYRHCRTIGVVQDDDTFDGRPARTLVFTLNNRRNK